MFLYRTLQVVNREKEMENQLTKLKIGESISPVPDYFESLSGAQGFLNAFYYDGGRYAFVGNGKFLDMNTMKLTNSHSIGNVGDIHGDIAAWIQTWGEAPNWTSSLVFLDLDTKFPKYRDLPIAPAITDMYFSNDGVGIV